MTWSVDIERILENIRVNSLLLTTYHKTQYFRFKKQLKWFRIPVIIISALASVFNVGLQPYIEQSIISGVCCILSLIVGIIGSLEMYLQIQQRMENELIMSKDYYLVAIDIYKVLKLGPENRNGEGIPFLEDKYTTYVKLFENSNLLEDDKLNDELAYLPSNNNNSQTLSFVSHVDNVIRRFNPLDRNQKHANKHKNSISDSLTPLTINSSSEIGKFTSNKHKHRVNHNSNEIDDPKKEMYRFSRNVDLPNDREVIPDKVISPYERLNALRRFLPKTTSVSSPIKQCEVFSNNNTEQKIKDDYVESYFINPLSNEKNNQYSNILNSSEIEDLQKETYRFSPNTRLPNDSEAISSTYSKFPTHPYLQNKKHNSSNNFNIQNKLSSNIENPLPELCKLEENRLSLNKNVSLLSECKTAGLRISNSFQRLEVQNNNQDISTEKPINYQLHSSQTNEYLPDNYRFTQNIESLNNYEDITNSKNKKNRFIEQHEEEIIRDNINIIRNDFNSPSKSVFGSKEEKILKELNTLFNPNMSTTSTLTSLTQNNSDIIKYNIENVETIENNIIF